jgi:hypothetical protein
MGYPIKKNNIIQFPVVQKKRPQYYYILKEKALHFGYPLSNLLEIAKLAIKDKQNVDERINDFLLKRGKNYENDVYYLEQYNKIKNGKSKHKKFSRKKL